MFQQDEGEEARRRSQQEERERADRLHAGDWVAGRLLAHGTAPYRFDPEEGRSYYVRLQTTHGRQELWGADLERAMQESKSHARVGDAVGVRIVRREKLEDQSWNRWEVDRATYIVKVRRVAHEILENTFSTLRTAKEGASVTGGDLLVAGAELLARVQFTDEASRKNYIATVREAAGLKGRPFEESRLPVPDGEHRPNRRAEPQEQGDLADRLYAGAWVGGRLLAHGKAPYRFQPNSSDSYYVRLQTVEGRQVLWGADLARAIQQSKSPVKVGDPVGVRIASRERLDSGRMWNRWEVDQAMHIVKEKRAAAEILANPLVARRAGKDGIAMTGSYLLIAGAKMLARVQFTDEADRKSFVDTIRTAGLRARPFEKPTAHTQDGQRSQEPPVPHHAHQARSEGFARD